MTWSIADQGGRPILPARYATKLVARVRSAPNPLGTLIFANDSGLLARL